MITNNRGSTHINLLYAWNIIYTIIHEIRINYAIKYYNGKNTYIIKTSKKFCCKYKA